MQTHFGGDASWVQLGGTAVVVDAIPKLIPY
jgi:hypothetical protein